VIIVMRVAVAWRLSVWARVGGLFGVVFSARLLIPLTGRIARVSLAVFFVFSLVYYRIFRSLLYRPVSEGE